MSMEGSVNQLSLHPAMPEGFHRTLETCSSVTVGALWASVDIQALTTRGKLTLDDTAVLFVLEKASCRDGMVGTWDIRSTSNASHSGYLKLQWEVTGERCMVHSGLGKNTSIRAREHVTARV